jgi:hypothetical protein
MAEQPPALTLEDERDLLEFEMQRHPAHWRRFDADGYESGVLYGDDIEYERLNARFQAVCERIMGRDGERR